MSSRAGAARQCHSSSHLGAAPSRLSRQGASGHRDDVWPSFEIDEKEIERMWKEGLLPPSMAYKAGGGGGPPSMPEEYTVILVDQLRCGLIFPLSSFCHDVLGFYGIQLMHLFPDSILLLSSFAHLCEAYLGILPSRGLFSFFFYLERSCLDPSKILSTYSFRLRDSRSEDYLPFPRTRPWPGQAMRWLLAGGTDNVPALKNAPAIPSDDWTDEPGELQYFLHCCDAIAGLCDRNMSIGHVVEDFLNRRLSPLRERADPAWVHAFGEDPQQEFRELLRASPTAFIYWIGKNGVYKEERGGGPLIQMLLELHFSHGLLKEQFLQIGGNYTKAAGDALKGGTLDFILGALFKEVSPWRPGGPPSPCHLPQERREEIVAAAELWEVPDGDPVETEAVPLARSTPVARAPLMADAQRGARGQASRGRSKSHPAVSSRPKTKRRMVLAASSSNEEDATVGSQPRPNAGGGPTPELMPSAKRARSARVVVENVAGSSGSGPGLSPLMSSTIVPAGAQGQFYEAY